MAARAQLKDRFYANVERRSSGDCWLWLGTRDKQGYGVISHLNKQLRAHRMAYALAHNVTLRSDQCVLHSCDTPACVNPDHLRIGTPGDNWIDCVNKGRHYHGVRHHAAKIDGAASDEIRSLYSLDRSRRGRGSKGLFTQTELAEIFGISRGAINHIVNGRSWRHAV